MTDRRARWYDMSAQERDELIVELRRRGVPLQKIAQRVGMSKSGVLRALYRIQEGRPGRDARG